MPITGEFELTANCNFKCSFCYLDYEKHNKELNTQTWKTIFDNAIKNNLLFANITGGEVFLRKDFIELYEYLFDQGVKISIFTNGSLISDEIIEVLRVKKPQYIAITVYGYDNESYNLITKNKHSFDSVRENIIKLNQNNIKVLLRAIPIKYTYGNLDRYIDFVKSLNMKLYYFSYVTKTETIDNPYQRLSPEELLDFESRIQQAFAYKKAPIRFEHDYKSCTALRSSYFINHLGDMMPCALAYEPKKSIINNDFLSTFKELGIKLAELEKQHPCFVCEFLASCNSCYARRLNENGNSHCGHYLKEIAKKREKHYKICNLDIVLKHRYQEYFIGNLEKYESISSQDNSTYRIRTHFVDSISLPKEEPTYRYSTRYVYLDDKTETIYATDELGKVKEKFVKSKDYKKYDLYFTKDDDTTLAEKEYIFTGIAFMDIASHQGYIPIHGSAIDYKGKTIIFSAPSGTGKSTLANHWINVYNDSYIFNDDKPIIHPISDAFFVSGTPWSGKDTINKNVSLPLDTIIFLSQGKENIIKKLSEK